MDCGVVGGRGLPSRERPAISLFGQVCSVYAVSFSVLIFKAAHGSSPTLSVLFPLRNYWVVLVLWFFFLS